MGSSGRRIRCLLACVLLAVASATGATAHAAGICPQVVCPEGGGSCCGGGTVGGGSGPASSVLPGVSASADGWLHYTETLTAADDLTGAVTTTVTGVKQADGTCAITDAGGALAGPQSSADAVELEEETAFNPSTCQEQVTSGTLTQTGVQRLAQQEPAATSGNSLGAASASADASVAESAGVAPAAASTASYESAYIKTSWVDPVFITITSLTDDLSWPLYGAAGTLRAAAKPYEFKYDGWSSTGATLGPFVTRPNNSGWSVRATDKFTNSDFATFIYSLLGAVGWAACGFTFSVTAHFYHDVTVYGYRNDTRNRAWNDKVDGACSNLVHHREASGFGWK